VAKNKYKQMKKYIVFTLIITVFCSCGNKEVITKNIKFPYDFCPYNNGLLISNFGGDTLNYANTQPTGFISHYKNGRTEILIAPSGVLHSPKGLAVKQDYLFVADVGKIVVFSLASKQVIDQIVFPQCDSLVNDLLILGETLFISVTNSNKIYLLNIENPENIDHSSLLEYVYVELPKTLLEADYHLFIASREIYLIDDLNNPALRTLTSETFDYQGICFSEDKTQLLFTDNSKSNQIGVLNFEDGEIVYRKVKNSSSNSELISLIYFDNKLFISDLINNKILIEK
jgi:hypothetical protein